MTAIPDQKRYSYEEFLNITKNDDRRAEFIDGIIYYQATPSLRHQNIIVRFSSKLNSYFENKRGCSVFTAPYDVLLRRGNNIRRVQPDIFILCKEEIDMDVNEIEAVPELIVEVLSPSNAWYDVSEKLLLYQKSGVAEYWIVKPTSKTIDVYTLKDGYYGEPSVYSKDDIAESNIFDNFSVALQYIFNY